MLNEVLRRLRSLAELISVERVRVYLLAVGAIVGVYTILFHRYYPVLEGRPISWPESLLFVMQTVTTVGYGELLPFSNEWTSLFSVLMMTTGIVMFFIAVPVLLTPLLSRMLHGTPPRRTARALEDHVVIIGYDDTVRSILESLRVGDVPVVIVEEDEAKAMQAYTRYRGTAHVVWGDPGLASTRSAASLGAARYVVVVGREQWAANTLLAVRDRTPAKLIAIVDDPAFDRYLRYAGAEYVLSPKHMVGRILARHGFVAADVEAVADATPPDSVFRRPSPHGQDLVLVKAPVIRGSPAIDRTLDEIGFYPKYGVEPLILWRGGQFTVLPGGDAVVDASAMLFLLGRTEEIADAIEHELRVPGAGDRHAVIAGFGDVGSAAYRELDARRIDCTVIDPRDHDIPTVVGRAEDETVLKRSGIETAQLLVVAVNDDAVNIFTTLMARNQNPDLKIVARANHAGAVDRLYRAGADFVALQPTVGGQVVAGIVLADRVRILLDLPNGQRVVQRRWMRGYPRTAGWLEGRTGAVVVGVEGAESVVVRPGPEYTFREGDRVMLIGGVKELRRCIRLM
ncbi:MAG: NAD-binding protein [Methanospirillum sp.]